MGQRRPLEVLLNECVEKDLMIDEVVEIHEIN